MSDTYAGLTVTPLPMCDTWMSITIRRSIESQNKRDSAHWSKRSRDAKIWYNLIRAQLPPKESPDHLVRIHIISYRNRFVDQANLIGGSKPLPDALVRLGYLRDDSLKWMEATYQQIKCTKDAQRTEILFLNLAPSSPSSGPSSPA